MQEKSYNYDCFIDADLRIYQIWYYMELARLPIRYGYCGVLGGMVIVVVIVA